MANYYHVVKKGNPQAPLRWLILKTNSANEPLETAKSFILQSSGNTLHPPLTKFEQVVEISKSDSRT